MKLLIIFVLCSIWLTACTPDPVLRRACEDAAIQEKIDFYHHQVDSLKKTQKTIWDM